MSVTAPVRVQLALFSPVQNIETNFQTPGLKNVVIVGLSGAGKSSLVNMLCPGANADTSNDVAPCTKEPKPYPCILRSNPRQECIVHDTVCIPEGESLWFKLNPVNWKIWDRSKASTRRYVEELVNRRELHLLVYCISGQRSDLKKSSQTKNYKKFKSIVGTDVPVVVVVTKLESCSREERANWWSQNTSDILRLGMDTGRPGACVTAVPWEGRRSGLYEECRDVVKNLINERLS